MALLPHPLQYLLGVPGVEGLRAEQNTGAMDLTEVAQRDDGVHGVSYSVSESVCVLECTIGLSQLYFML